MRIKWLTSDSLKMKLLPNPRRSLEDRIALAPSKSKETVF